MRDDDDGCGQILLLVVGTEDGNHSGALHNGNRVAQSLANALLLLCSCCANKTVAAAAIQQQQQDNNNRGVDNVPEEDEHERHQFTLEDQVDACAIEALSCHSSRHRCNNTRKRRRWRHNNNNNDNTAEHLPRRPPTMGGRTIGSNSWRSSTDRVHVHICDYDDYDQSLLEEDPTNTKEETESLTAADAAAAKTSSSGWDRRYDQVVLVMSFTEQQVLRWFPLPQNAARHCDHPGTRRIWNPPPSSIERFLEERIPPTTDCKRRMQMQSPPQPRQNISIVVNLIPAAAAGTGRAGRDHNHSRVHESMMTSPTPPLPPPATNGRTMSTGGSAVHQQEDEEEAAQQSHPDECLGDDNNEPEEATMAALYYSKDIAVYYTSQWSSSVSATAHCLWKRMVLSRKHRLEGKEGG
jgi:hypothetical protein